MTPAETYQAHWATLTGQPAASIYVPQQLRDTGTPPPAIKAGDVVTFGATRRVRHIVKGTADLSASGKVLTWCGKVRTPNPIDPGTLADNMCKQCGHNKDAEAERRAARNWRFQ